MSPEYMAIEFSKMGQRERWREGERQRYKDIVSYIYICAYTKREQHANEDQDTCRDTVPQLREMNANILEKEGCSLHIDTHQKSEVDLYASCLGIEIGLAAHWL